MAKLTPKQERFVQEYLVDLNGKQAAIRAGYSERSAESQASALLRVPKVAEALARAKQARAERVNASADDVLRELTRIALFDPAKCFGPDGKLLPITEMPQEARAVVAGLDIEEGADAGSVLRKLKSWDKVRALELLGKHLGLLKDKVELAGDGGGPLSVHIDLGAGKP